MKSDVIINNKAFKTPINNFWNHIHFHPTDAIEDDWGREILDQVASDKAAISVRMYTMFEDIVSMDENGVLQYDYTLNDMRLDYMIEKGFQIVLCYNFIPPCIATDTEEINAVNKRKTRYKGKMITISPPKDYRLWEEICENYTRHIVKKYGEERLSNWLFQCYNEPDTCVFWMKNETNLDIRLAEYCKLYNGFEKGVKRVSEKLKIGGPALAEKPEFLDGFLKFVNRNSLKLDFVSIHIYGTSPGKINANIKPICHKNSDERIDEVVNICKENGLHNLPLVVDEWGASVAGYLNIEDCPKLIFRETEAFAAYYVKMITHYIEKKMPLDRIMICLSGQHELETEFAGCRTFFTMNGIAKPIYNAHILAGKLGDKLIPVTKNSEDENLSILATEDEEGNVKVILGYASNNFDIELPDRNISFELETDEKYIITVWQIDADNANAMSAFKKAEGDIGIAKSYAKLKSRQLEGFSNKTNVILKNNSVTLLEFTKK